MVSFEARDIWNAIIEYPKSANDLVVGAFVDFCEKLSRQPDDHIIVIWTQLPKATEYTISATLTNLDGMENPPSHEKFMAIPGDKNMKKTTVAIKVAEFTFLGGK
ncbi:hypothetical protein F4810DRAFT_652379 [Camillea tinctor]|nr:hypothetical protein F4810DRAFT_652379 [Camillea tinctor]